MSVSTPTSTLRSLCCGAPPSGTSRMLITSSGYSVGFCSACNGHSAFTPQGEGRLVPMALPALPDPQEAREQQLNAIERRLGRVDLFKVALGLIGLSIVLLALFYASWALGERERRERGAEGGGEVGGGGVGGLAHTHVM
jgi:hypothetical protein